MERLGGPLGRGDRMFPPSAHQAQACQFTKGQSEQDAAIVFTEDTCHIEIKINSIFLSPWGRTQVHDGNR